MKKYNKKSIFSAILAMFMAIGLMAVSTVKASASTTITDKNKVALCFRESNYVYHASYQFANYIRVNKNIANKKVYLRYRDQGEEWQTEEARYVADLDNDYEIYVAYCGKMGGYYECDLVCESGDTTYIDDNDGKHYTGQTLGTASVCALRTPSPCDSYFKVSALVKNYAYEKEVAVRYTTDGWKTYKEAELKYDSVADDGNEIWSTTLNLPEGTISGDKFEYAIRYTVNGNTYWDNNFGRNYNASYHHNYL